MYYNRILEYSLTPYPHFNIDIYIYSIPAPIPTSTTAHLSLELSLDYFRILLCRGHLLYVPGFYSTSYLRSALASPPPLMTRLSPSFATYSWSNQWAADTQQQYTAADPGAVRWVTPFSIPGARFNSLGKTEVTVSLWQGSSF